MEKLGREMVRNCGGLPLAIVILGGILVTKPSLVEWEKVYDDSLSSLKKGKGLGENQQEQLFDILVRSYNVLPLQLKPCFLYLSKFMEDEWIDAQTLYQLWIAEGMVLSSDKREGETMMQVAESYMGELVHRSMVQVRLNDDLESSLMKFESCSLHDLMRDVSLSQAKEEDFFEAIDIKEVIDVNLKRSVVSGVTKTRQLVFYHKRGVDANSYFTKKPNHQQYRSILLRIVDGYESQPLRSGLYFSNFKLLRVLSLEKIRLLDQLSVFGTLFGTEIGSVLGNLAYLRYLSLRGSYLDSLPQIHKLVLLQTLNLDNYGCAIFKSNNVLDKLAFLRHLYLPLFVSLKSAKNSKLRFNELSKLETLENFNSQWCEVKDLPMLSSLRRLKLKAEGGYDDVKEMFKYLSDLALSSNSSIRYMGLDIQLYSDPGFRNDPEMLRQLFWNYKLNLRELTMHGKLPELSEIFEQQQQLNHTHIDVCSIRITTLTLWGSCLEQDPMPVLEKIPTLRELDLFNAYEGKEMVCSAMGFPRLTKLTLWHLYSFESWRVGEGSMPLLLELVIWGCRKLKELPEELIFLNSLRQLWLSWMPSKFCDRVRLENGEQGPDFYKVAHVPDLIIEKRRA